MVPPARSLRESGASSLVVGAQGGLQAHTDLRGAKGEGVSERWIWIAKWEEFQHYRPERDRPPAWLKDYTKQLRDERYLSLTDRQRALLGDVRRVFAAAFGRVPDDTRALTRHRHSHTLRSDLDALNHAGFIEYVSRGVLDSRLEALYDKNKKEKKIETPPNPLREGDEESVPQTLRAAGQNPRAKSEAKRRQESLEAFVTRSWDDYPNTDVLVDELCDRGCSASEADALVAAEHERRTPRLEVA